MTERESGAGEAVPGETQVSLAYARTHLANERTYAAWVRTGLAVAGAGYVVARFAVEPGGSRQLGVAVGFVLVVVGAGVIAFGAYSFRRVCARLTRAGSTPTVLSERLVFAISGALIVALAALLLLF